MRPLLVSILAFLLICLPDSPSASQSVIDKTIRSIVEIEFAVDGEQTHVCTGFVVDAARGQALTARHCVGNELTVDGQVSEVIKADETLALVKVPAMRKPPLEIRKKSISLGERVWSLGFGYGKMKVFSRAISGWVIKDVILDGPLAPGMSGGPIVDKDGKVVGVNQASNQVLGIGCGYLEIRAFLTAK